MDLFRQNAFRITGLPVDATAREISRHADKLTMLAELGQDPLTQYAVFAAMPRPSLDEIRDAIQKLKDPEKRLVDEFFWFWPEDFENGHSDRAIQAMAAGDSEKAISVWVSRENEGAGSISAKHNLALLHHVFALDGAKTAKNGGESEWQQKVSSHWTAAFIRWKCLCSDERLWDMVAARIRQLNEPKLPPEFVRRIRAALPQALAKINAELALAFVESGKIEAARLHIQFIREANLGLDKTEKTAELVLTPAKNRLRAQIQRAESRAKDSPRDAANAARDLLEEARQTLTLFDLFFGQGSELRNELFDEVARICNQLAVAYLKETKDDRTCLEILRAVLPFAATAELKQQIEDNIATLSKNLESERLYGSLKPISSAPSLHTINGFGFTLYGSTDPDPENGSYLATYYFVAIGFPVFPICRYRVASTPNGYRFFGKAPLRPFDKWHLAIFFGLMLWVVIAIVHSANDAAPSNSVRYTPPPSRSSDSPAYALPQATSAPVSGENVYRPTFDDGVALVREKAAIETERRKLEALDAQVGSLGREIERDRLSLDATDEWAVNQFNAKVGRYNERLQNDRDATAAFNERVDNYNAKLRPSGR